MGEEITTTAAVTTGAAVSRRFHVSMVLYPLLTFTALFFAWQYLARAFGVPE